MTRLAKLLFPILAILALAACEGPDRYPVSGEECNPDDPVQDLDAADCAIPNLGGVV